MIELHELNKNNYPADDKMKANLVELCRRLNIVRAAWAKPMIVTSGLRSAEAQEALIREGKTNATQSKHLSGEAADIYDPEWDLKNWLLTEDGNQVLIDAGLWCEAPSATPNWCHFQSVPPASGHRWFLP